MMTNLKDLPVSSLPLIFLHNSPVVGEGFVAWVSIRGRVLAEWDDQEGVVLSGIVPGALATDTDCQTLREAHADFRTLLTQILYDIARDARDFEHFKREVEVFGASTSPRLEARWKHSLDDLRAHASGVNSFHLGLTVQSATAAPFVRVSMVMPDALTSDRNRIDPAPSLAVADAA
jgi:hypothetical protein